MVMECTCYQRVEISLAASVSYSNPFADVDVYGTFLNPDGKEMTVQGYHDGGGRWVVRFTPNVPGEWSYRTCSFPADAGLQSEGRLVVKAACEREKGFIKAVPGEGWGLAYENGEQQLILGDTMYNLFGAAYCGVDVEKVLARRKAQGFNFLRVRMPVSPYHTGCPDNLWQNRSVWLWGGSPQLPDYTSFNLAYFQSVDRTLALLEEMGFGVELILEAWIFEVPFNDRARFLPEYEELYIRYVVSRYSAFKCIHIWCTANEYNLYLGFSDEAKNSSVADKFAIRLAGLIKTADPYMRPVAVHNTGMKKSFKESFRHCKDIDVLMFQDWGDITTPAGRELVTGMDLAVEKHLTGSGKVNVMSEYGYEVVPGSGISPSWHDGLGPGHTRRGAWRALFAGVHMISGFDNTWGAQFSLEQEPEGANQILPLARFFTERVCFHRLKPDKLLLMEEMENLKPEGEKTLCLVRSVTLIESGVAGSDPGSTNRDWVEILSYQPVGAEFGLKVSVGLDTEAFWYDPLSGQTVSPVEYRAEGVSTVFTTPGGDDGTGLGKDWVLVLRKRGMTS